MPPKKNGLGRGLSEIFMQNESEDHNDTITLKISEIEPNKNQPRREFEPESLNELSESIAQHGVLQPLVVRPLFGGGYEIVAGERRFRAARMAGLTNVPVVVRELTDSEAMELALVENLQREDLSDLELAMGYESLMKEYGMTQEQISGIVNKSRSAVANTLRLLKLPESIKIMLKNGDISAGHARALLALENEDMLEMAARSIIDNNLSVRETEKMVAQINKETDQSDKEIVVKEKQDKRPQYYREVELSLSESFGRKVVVNQKSKNSGTLVLEFYGEDDLKELLSHFKED
ncbi:MAG: ParB/RepB/Spo0J family partition protein [Acutalibacteraceae bacterium]|nr:ParB/RepB/Spo0J family partition protein [Clostridia bacterium]MEE3450628.1 ParB/RepB/Spo0J family partition protein [Acutalibacteraceae bacterium]